MTMHLAAVALSDAARSFDKLYDYSLSSEDSIKATPGMRVLVPFGRGNKVQSAWIIRLHEGDGGKKLKEVSEIVDDEPLLSSEMIKLAEWMKTRYFCTWGDAIRVMLPAGVNLRRQMLIRLAKKPGTDEKSMLSDSQIQILNKLSEKPEGIPEQELGCSDNCNKDIKGLVKKGYIEAEEIFDQKINEKKIKAVQPNITKEEFGELIEEGKVKSIHYIRVMESLYTDEICSLQDLLLIGGVTHATIRAMAKKGWVSYYDLEIERDPFENMEFERTDAPELTLEQRNVLDDVLPLLDSGKLDEVLLHGITGSGKTEIYLRLIEAAIKKGKTAIVLVPEISLTPQMTSRFTGRFGDRVAIQHSRLSQGERYDQWRKIRSGGVDVVIGARSAIFAPLKNISVIIIDEEHESSYKSENTPKYDARHVARARCNINKAILVMGSATPSVETYYRALSGKIRLEVMKSRPNEMPLPSVKLVDLREEIRDGNRGALSRILEEELVKTKENGEQSIVFINRRGYASFLLCRDCGFVLKCPHCSVSLTVHTHDRQAICHYCGYTMNIPEKCPECASVNIKTLGIGTQRIEEELRNHPANFKTIRMDLDTTGGKLGHQKILDAFRKKEADVLIGTQMVAKGHDFPDVTLVGIISADASLFNGDYRSSERTFELITQAAGRAGRGAKPGKVILQAYNIDDYSIKTATAQDYESFYRSEIAIRKKLILPPYCHMGLIMVSAEDPEDAKKSIDSIRQLILVNYMEKSGFICSDSMPSPVYIIRGRARWRLIIKMASINKLVELMNNVLDNFHKLKTGGADISVDIDPAGML
jgi:primosomal protein N' (replication factor Y)